MKIKRASISLGVVTFLYLLVLVWADSNQNVFHQLIGLSTFFPLLLLLAVFSYVMRYVRWHWLLYRIGYSISPGFGFLSYISGFAFTATPGKVGELVRIRYFKQLGVPHYRVISAFVFERAFDLIVVLGLASLVASQFYFFPFVVAFVVLVISGLVFLARSPQLLSFFVAHLRLHRWVRLSRLLTIVRNGISGITVWSNALDITIAVIIGALAWGAVSMAFVVLLGHVGVDVPLIAAIAIYPLSMLAGAATMLPGGVGSTEVTIVGMLLFFGVPIGLSVTVAVGIRLATLWFAIFCGFISIFILEHKLLNRAIMTR